MYCTLSYDIFSSGCCLSFPFSTFDLLCFSCWVNSEGQTRETQSEYCFTHLEQLSECTAHILLINKILKQANCRSLSAVWHTFLNLNPLYLKIIVFLIIQKKTNYIFFAVSKDSYMILRPARALTWDRQQRMVGAVIISVPGETIITPQSLFSRVLKRGLIWKVQIFF